MPTASCGREVRAAERRLSTADYSRRRARLLFAAAQTLAAVAGSGEGALVESAGAGEGIRTLDFNLGKVALYP
jgi:hypothetical protein